jgi:hypothetical protein
MPTIIKTKNSVTATNVPSSLQQGEVAINITDKKVWVGNAATTPILLLGSGADGTFTNLSVTGVATFGAGTVSLPSITTTGDTNTGIFFPAADTIAFTEGGVESMRIDSSGRVGINTTNPLSKLHINGASSNPPTSGTTPTGVFQMTTDSAGYSLYAGGYSTGSFSPWLQSQNKTDLSDYGQLILQPNGGNVGIGIGSSSPTAKLDIQQSTTDLLGISLLNTNNTVGAATSSQLRMGITNSAGVSYAVIKAQETNVDDWPAITFSAQNAVTTTPTERMRVNWDGNVLIGITSSNANGGCLQLKSGITFPATQSASSDANTLDDYEEGSWTPTFEGGTTNPTLTYAAQVARYTKIGNVVTVNGRIRVGVIAVAGSGTCFIAGLPFATSNVSNLQNGGCIGTAFNWSTTNNGAPDGISADSGVTIMILRVYKNDAGKVTGWTQAETADLQNDTGVDFQMTYKV